MKQISKKSETSSRKIYYLFAFLFTWYGIAWLFFPTLLKKIEATGTESQILFFKNLSFIFLTIFTGLAIVLIVVSHYLYKKKGAVENL